MSFGTASARTGYDVALQVEDPEDDGHNMGGRRGRGRGRDGGEIYEMVGMK